MGINRTDVIGVTDIVASSLDLSYINPELEKINHIALFFILIKKGVFIWLEYNKPKRWLGVLQWISDFPSWGLDKSIYTNSLSK